MIGFDKILVLTVDGVHFRTSVAGEVVAYQDFNLSLTATPVVGTDNVVEGLSCVEVDKGISNFVLTCSSFRH
jgi:hypothetical protein